MEKPSRRADTEQELKELLSLMRMHDELRPFSIFYDEEMDRFVLSLFMNAEGDAYEFEKFIKKLFKDDPRLQEVSFDSEFSYFFCYSSKLSVLVYLAVALMPKVSKWHKCEK